MYTGLHVEYPLFLSDCNEPWILLTDFQQNTQIPNCMKIHPVETVLFQVGRWKDGHDKAKLHFANMPKNTAPQKHEPCEVTEIQHLLSDSFKRLRWSRGSVLAFGTKVPRRRVPTRPKPSNFFLGKKILSTPSFGGEVKPSVPCRRFTACKRTLNATSEVGHFKQNSSAISRPHSSTFGY
jgi:hypothetical protein